MVIAMADVQTGIANEYVWVYAPHDIHACSKTVNDL